jgi:hypothetical protein
MPQLCAAVIAVDAALITDLKRRLINSNDVGTLFISLI